MKNISTISIPEKKNKGFIGSYFGGTVAEFGKFPNFVGFGSETVIEWKTVYDFASNGQKL